MTSTSKLTRQMTMITRTVLTEIFVTDVTKSGVIINQFIMHCHYHTFSTHLLARWRRHDFYSTGLLRSGLAIQIQFNICSLGGDVMISTALVFSGEMRRNGHYDKEKDMDNI